MPMEEKIELVSRLNRAQYALTMINELIICMAEMDSERFEMVLNSSNLYLGVHEMIRQVIVPFAEKVGLFQKLDDKSYIANLILVKEIIKRKLHSGIEELTIIRKNTKQVVLFVPESERQELPLLYLHYLFQLEGFRTLYLGKHVSVDILERICFYKKPDYIVTVSLEKKYQKELVSFVDRLPDTNPETVFISFGNQLPVNFNKFRYRNFDRETEVMSYVLLKNQE